MKKFVESALIMVIALCFTVAILLSVYLLLETYRKSDCSSVNLYSSDYSKIVNFSDDEYIILIDDGKSVTVIPRDGQNSTTYTWSHVDRIFLEKEE